MQGWMSLATQHKPTNASVRTKVESVNKFLTHQTSTLIPRTTAGRSAIASYQRRTAEKSARSIACHSCRPTHGKVAILAIE